MLLDAWEEHQPEPYYNQLKQLSESPDITPKQVFSRPQLPKINSSIKQQNCLKTTNRNLSFSVVERSSVRPIKLKKESLQLSQQQYSFHDLSPSPSKKKTTKNQDISLRQYKVRIKNKTHILTKRSPLHYLSRLLLKLDQI